MERYVHRVNYYETDKMGITHHSNYIRFMEEARVFFLDQIGWGYAKMEEDGIASPVLAVTCDYRHSTTFSDVIEVEVSVLKLSAVKLQIGYTMSCNGQVVCKGTSTHCFLDREGRPLVLQKALPDFYSALAALIPPSA
ncbi:MAG: acyl-CoA thioesterase [Treponema sp.]|nr:acyl-CoA thioesterase [Treponema sp.]